MPKHKSKVRRHKVKTHKARAHKHVVKRRRTATVAKKTVLKVPKSPVLAALQKAGIQFEVLHHGKDAYTCEDAARLRNRPLNTLVKSLILTDGVSFVMACVPGDMRIDAPKIREVFGTGKLEFAHEEDLKKLTGMQMGATAPVGMKKEIPVVIDSALLDRPKVNISGGSPAFGVEISSADLLRITKAKVAGISKR
ncbi:MAG: YbaK/EbsC family protein [Candidatus Aenigmatarchaeota archaeon]